MQKHRAISEDYRIPLVSNGYTPAVDFSIEVAYGVRIHKSNKTKSPRIRLSHKSPAGACAPLTTNCPQPSQTSHACSTKPTCCNHSVTSGLATTRAEPKISPDIVEYSATLFVTGGGRKFTMGTLIDFVFLHSGELFCIGLGIGVILYSCLARRFTFEGDVAVKSEGRQFYEATPEMRIYGVILGMLPLLYGLYSLISPLIVQRSRH